MQNITLSYTKLWELFAASHEERLTFFKDLNNKKSVGKKPEKQTILLSMAQQKALLILKDILKLDYITAKDFALNYWPNSINNIKSAGSAGNILHPLVKLKLVENKNIKGTILFKISGNGIAYLLGKGLNKTTN